MILFVELMRGNFKIQLVRTTFFVQENLVAFKVIQIRIEKPSDSICQIKSDKIKYDSNHVCHQPDDPTVPSVPGIPGVPGGPGGPVGPAGPVRPAGPVGSSLPSLPSRPE